MKSNKFSRFAGFSLVEGLVCLSIAGIFGAVAYQAVTDPQSLAASMPGEDKAKRALDDAGIDKVQLGNRNYYGCAQDDAYGIEFSGTNARGKTVNGIVCMDYMKGSTIRYR
jgi:prepilin-type N-terminal cleavage/methylation domain-containing protein